MLSDLKLQIRYRSSDDDLLRDFYLPCLEQSVSYDRAVGYFSSYALAAAASGLPTFIGREGTMRLIASPDLSDEDVDAIERGYRAREDVVEAVLLRALRGEGFPDPIKQRLGFLAWLVAEERLEIKIAVVTPGPARGIYHEKIGVFADADGDYVAFEGSANESRGGLIENFESVLVFQSAIPGHAPIAESLRRDFDRLWEDDTPRLDIIEFPDAVRNELLTRYKPERSPAADLPPSSGRLEVEEPRRPALPAGKPLRDYQNEALAAWFRNQGRGLFQMATGTGKTVTALALLVRLYEALREQDRSLVVVVLCPYQHLVSQWVEEARQFGIDPIACFRARSYWFDDLAASVEECRRGHRPLVMAIATNATFQTDAFQQVLGRCPPDTLLLADEVHNVGAAGLRRLLPEHVAFRLGLSATPERWYDDEGTAALQDYFGPVVYELGLEEAIKLGALTPYDYHPVVVELAGAELEDYLELTAKITQRLGRSSGDLGERGEDPILEQLLIRRARILALAEDKLPRLERIVRPLRDTHHNLFYCGDGQVEYAASEEQVRQLDAVVHLLGRGLGMSVNSYTAETYLDERDRLRRRFASGDLQGLVAIRCLDEGVDIPETRRAFILASSTNPKQFIQRRGRILRLYPGKDKAAIYDFLVVPPADAVASENQAVERRLVKRELERVALFARLAQNGPEALRHLEDLRKRYNLLHIA